MTITQIKSFINSQLGVNIPSFDMSPQLDKEGKETGWTSSWFEDTTSNKRVRLTMHNDTLLTVRGNREFSGLVIHSAELKPAHSGVDSKGVVKEIGEYTKYLITMPKSVTDSF